MAHLDMAATLAALVGVSIQAGQCADSVNVLPALLGESRVGRAEFVTHVGGIKGPFAVRQGEWKLITAGPGGYGKVAKSANKPAPPAVPQLYNLRADPAEAENLAGANPNKVAEMQQRLQRIRGEPLQQ